MAQTTAQRQAAWRARRATAGKDGNGERRLDMWISTEADLALARLARRYGVTKRQMLERFITRADDAIVRRLDPDSTQWDACFNARRQGSCSWLPGNGERGRAGGCGGSLGRRWRRGLPSGEAER
jgi:hypothetical protein